MCTLFTLWALFVRLVNWLAGKSPVKNDLVLVDDEKIRRVLSDGREESVRWDDLQQVVIVTTSAGPWAEDVFWYLFGTPPAGCIVPQGATGSGELLEALARRLPGFAHLQVIQAMGSCTEATFPCWRRAYLGADAQE